MNRFLQFIFDSRAPSSLCVAALLLLLAFHSPALAQQQPAAQETPPKVVEVVEETKINVLPLRVITARVVAMLRNEGRPGTQAAFEMNVSADRLEDGTLENVVFDAASPADEEIHALTRQLVNAVSQSKLLGFLRDVPRVQLAFRVKEDVSIRISGETSSAERARTAAQAFGVLLHTASQANKGTDAGELLAAIKSDAEGKLLTVTFRMPRAAVADILSRVRTAN